MSPSKPILYLEGHGVDAEMSATIAFPQDDLGEAIAISDEADLSMPLNEKDKTWIREAIQEALKVHGWGRLARFIREWGGFGAAVAILIFAFTQWTAYTEFRTHTGDRLTGLEGEANKSDQRLREIERLLNEIKGELSKQSLYTHSALAPEDFNASLPNLRRSLADARKENVKVPPAIINGIAEKLSATPENTPEYWPAVGEAISYRSQMVESWPKTNLPSCYDKPPTMETKIITLKDKNEIATLKWPPFVYRDCEVDLEAPIPPSLSEKLRHLSLAMPAETSGQIVPYHELECDRCKVVYHGGHIGLFDQWIDKLVFVDSFFDISLPSSPTRRERALVMSLLSTADIKHIYFIPPSA
jgi:hypothetical protein